MIDTPTPIATEPNQATRLAAPGRRNGDPSAAPVFAGLLDRARTEGADAQAQLREAAEKLVSTTFIMPMFEQLRNDPLASNLMHGGRAEKIFQQQLDQVLSDRIAGATRFDLIDSVYNQLANGVAGKAVDTHG
ncbi:MAG: rod-binding protein [Phycisphaeraceae bacterium]